MLPTLSAELPEAPDRGVPVRAAEAIAYGFYGLVRASHHPDVAVLLRFLLPSERPLGAEVHAVLEYTDANADEIVALVRRADRETANGYWKGPFVTEATLERFWDVTVKGWEFTTEPVTPEERAKYPWIGALRVKPTDVPRDYTVPYLALAVPKKTVPLPLGYIVLPGQVEVVRNLLSQGIVIEKLVEGSTLPAERFIIEKVELAKNIYQGRVQNTLTGHYEKAEVEVPAGSLFVDMRQPLGRLIPVLLEPTSTDSLAAWGFFNRAIVRQWSNEPAPYPVLRLDRRPLVPLLLASAE
jgi:hypothetical protein